MVPVFLIIEGLLAQSEWDAQAAFSLDDDLRPVRGLLCDIDAMPCGMIGDEEDGPSGPSNTS
jgi:hypothetical protein